MILCTHAFESMQKRILIQTTKANINYKRRIVVMKHKKGNIEISVSAENKVFKTLISVDKLREFLAKGKGATVTLYKDGEPLYNVEFSYEDIYYMVNKYDMMQYSLIPRFLSKYLIDYTTVIASTTALPTAGREKELSKAWFYLSQDMKNNVFLVGDVDVGKTTVAQELIRQIVTGECPKHFYGKRVISFRFDELFEIKSNFKYERIVDFMINFIEKNRDNIIIYVDDALYLKFDEQMMKILHFIVKSNVPTIFCCRIDEYENLYLNDYFIKKFENMIAIEEPEYKEVYHMIENHIENIKATYQVEITENIAKFAIYTSNLLNSHSCNPGRTLDILIKAAGYAQIKGKNEVDKECVLDCYDSQYKLFNAYSEEDKRKIAYHEAGHFLTLIKSSNAELEKTACISILPTMYFTGANICYFIPERNTVLERDKIIDRIAIYLGGRVAEKEISNEFSTGASLDLDAANTLAEDMLMKYGLSSGDDKNRSFIVGGYYIKSYLLTDCDRERINAEIKSIIDEAYERAEKIVKNNLDILYVIAETLLEELVITGEDMEAIIKEYE